MTLLAVALAAAISVSPVSTVTPASQVLFHLQDKRIDEASGVAVATREAKVWFTHNDSGDSARFFALGPRGQTLATYDVIGATNVDWEDMAEAPGAGGVATLWLGDIGDNDAVRSMVEVYAVREPAVSSRPVGATVRVSGVRYRFRYPDGAHNAESLLVDPRTSRIYVATKSYDGTTTVYAAPAHPSTSAVNVLSRLVTLQWPFPSSAGSVVGIALAWATTGGAFSPDGHALVLRTYTDAYLFAVSGSSPAAIAKALTGRPRELRLPSQPQGEGVCFTRDGRDLVLTSEKVGSAVDEVMIPVAAKTQVLVTPAATATAVPTSPAAPTISASPASLAGGPVRPHRALWPAVVAGAAGVTIVVGGLVLWRRT